MRKTRWTSDAGYSAIYFEKIDVIYVPTCIALFYLSKLILLTGKYKSKSII